MGPFESAGNVSGSEASDQNYERHPILNVDAKNIDPLEKNAHAHSSRPRPPQRAAARILITLGLVSQLLEHELHIAQAQRLLARILILR